MTPNEKEWHTVFTAINAQGEYIPHCFVFKGIRPRRDYFSLCKSVCTFGLQKKGWVDSYQFSKWIDHFIANLKEKEALSTQTRYLLILDGYKAHLSLEVLTKAKANGVDMLTLPSHTSHGLQPLDVAIFKSFKVAYRAYKNYWCVRNSGTKVKKGNLAQWMSLAFKKVLTQSNITVGFRGSGIWPLNMEAVNSKMGPNEGFVPLTPTEVARDKEEVAEIIEEGIPFPPSNATHFFVNNEEEEVGEEDIVEDSPPTHNITNLLRLPQELPSRGRSNFEPLVDYSQSQVITSNLHLESLYDIQEKKKAPAREKEAIRIERELTKNTRAA